MTELRPIAASDYPMGPSGGEAMMGIHWTWKNDFPAVVNAAEYLYNHLYEEFKPRIHWGKVSPYPS